MARYKPLPGAQLPRIFRDLRRRAGYSQAKLAAKAGVSPSTVCKAEKGKVAPSQDLLDFYGTLARDEQRAML